MSQNACYDKASMKALCTTATLSLALLLTACSLNQQHQQQAAGPPDVPAAKPEEKDSPSSAKTSEASTDPAPPGTQTAPVPTQEQQQAAIKLTEGVADIDYTPEHVEQLTEAHLNTAEATAPTSPALPAGNLRMGSIIPQEDPASVGDAPAPSANSAERFGLRSPKMPTKLPMGIDGKIQNAQ